MLQKDIHITFSYGAQMTLSASEVLHLEDVLLVNLEDRLNIGPICDLKKNVEKRKSWLSDNFRGTDISNLFAEVVDKDIATIESLIANSKNISKVYLWTGLHTAELYEVLSAIRLLFHLNKLDIQFYMLDFPNIPMNLNGIEVVSPTTFNVVPIEQVKPLLASFKLIDKNELAKWELVWLKVLSGNSALRTIGENGQIEESDDSYYDNSLLKHCTTEFQNAARIIGYTLYDIDFSVGDSYLNWRLKQLVSTGKLESCGLLREIHEYEVRKIERGASQVL